MIACKAGVSKATVSRVLNDTGNVTEETSKKVKKVIEEMNYQPNELARSLRINSTNTIGVIISNILNPFFTSIVRVIEDYANANDYKVIICNTDEKIEKEKKYVETLINRKVDGLVIATTGNIKKYRKLVKTTPVVFIDRVPHKDDRNYFDMVLLDNKVAAYEATKYLIKQDYKKIGFITGNDVSTTGHERLVGYKEALKEFGIPIRSDLIKVGSFLGNDGCELANELLFQGDCDSIFTANSLILRGTLEAIKEFNGKEYRKIGIMSFDDEDWFDHSLIEINSIKQPILNMGEKAIEILLQRINKKRVIYEEVRYPAKIIIRKNTIKKR